MFSREDVNAFLEASCFASTTAAWIEAVQEAAANDDPAAVCDLIRRHGSPLNNSRFWMVVTNYRLPLNLSGSASDVVSLGLVTSSNAHDAVLELWRRLVGEVWRAAIEPDYPSPADGRGYAIPPGAYEEMVAKRWNEVKEALSSLPRLQSAALQARIARERDYVLEWVTARNERERAEEKTPDSPTESPLAFDCEDEKILRTLAQEPLRRFALVDLEAASGVSRKTAGSRVNRMIDQGLAARPEGPKGGVQITPLGAEKAKQAKLI